MKTRFFLFLFIIIGIMSCKEEATDLSSIEIPELFNTAKGEVFSANGTRPIGGALVFVLDHEEVYHTLTDNQGKFTLKLPVGNHQLHIQTGDGSNFRSTVDITVGDQGETIIPATATRLEQEANIAYVEGAYDQIQILIDALGYTATQIQYANLADYNVLKNYDIIFLNCGVELTNASIDLALATFVTNGGSLYTSDYAVAYLMGNEDLGSSDPCLKTNGFIPSETLCTDRVGGGEIDVTAEVTNTQLAGAMGYNTLDIHYDLGVWETVQNIDETFWNVMINDPAVYGPLMVHTNKFSNPDLVGEPVGENSEDGWITICHIPPGNPDNPITITINEEAWEAHEAHGDTLGPCDSDVENGNIFFTTFHTHAEGLNDDDSEKILEYIILNL